jgi:5-(carboxyamino)imidazole ribonucleotide synthase
MTGLPPGAVIGILGGGQLGRMLASAASQLGFDVHIFCPEADAPAARVAMKHWQADYTDSNALSGFARACDIVTLEFENIPVGAVEAIAATGTPLHPGAQSLAVSQDRANEKAFLRRIGITTTNYRVIDTESQINPTLTKLNNKNILKTQHNKYNNKKQT